MEMRPVQGLSQLTHPSRNININVLGHHKALARHLQCTSHYRDAVVDHLCSADRALMSCVMRLASTYVIKTRCKTCDPPSRFSSQMGKRKVWVPTVSFIVPLRILIAIHPFSRKRRMPSMSVVQPKSRKPARVPTRFTTRTKITFLYLRALNVRVHLRLLEWISQ